MISKVKKTVRKVAGEDSAAKLEKSLRFNRAKAANIFYGSPAKSLKVIAVTGTNGKTTTCALINEMIKNSGYKTAVYTTAFIEVAGRSEPNRTHMTIASPWAVQKFMARAKKAGVDWIVLEVTSHALDQYRIYGVPVELAVITNLSQEHLDYHKTMENYAEAKARLITEFKPKTVILNADDEWYEFFARKADFKDTSVGQGKANYQIKELKLANNGMSFKLIGADLAVSINTYLIGDFNAYNAAMAAVVGAKIGLSEVKITEGITKLQSVPGRMEQVDAGQPFAVLVDYAVTPDALEKALTSLQHITKGKVRVVFGATGDRDKTKRPFMGEIAAKFADKIYLTDDETYTEDGEAIRQAVKEGIIRAGGKEKLVEIADRKQAIKQALTDAKEGDSVLLAGIGHEDYRNMGGKKIFWDEKTVAKDLLAELGYS